MDTASVIILFLATVLILLCKRKYSNNSTIQWNPVISIVIRALFLAWIASQSFFPLFNNNAFTTTTSLIWPNSWWPVGDSTVIIFQSLGSAAQESLTAWSIPLSCCQVWRSRNRSQMYICSCAMSPKAGHWWELYMFSAYKQTAS